MSEEMVERVARALCAENGSLPWEREPQKDIFTRMAVAAIAAMQEPEASPAPIGPEIVNCIVCCEGMRNQFHEDKWNIQPQGGAVFETRGNYGSTYIDGGPLVEIVICDACLEDEDSKGHLYREPSLPASPSASEKKDP